jgi:predicted transcriptional regulator
MSNLSFQSNSPQLMTNCTPTINDVLLRYAVAYLQQSNQLVTIKLLCDELGADRKTVYRRVSSAVSSGQVKLLRRQSAGRFGFHYVIELVD